MLFSTEQVSKYHPDKVADQISDMLVSLALTKNKDARCAIETLVKDDTVVIAGEVGGVVLKYEEVKQAVKVVMSRLGYPVKEVIDLLNTQSIEISNAVVKDDIGAGDQGMMVGFATRETDSYLPFGFDLANAIIQTLEIYAEPNVFIGKERVLKGDAKCQVTYDIDTLEIDKVLVSVCHQSKYDIDYIRRYVTHALSSLVHADKLLINPAGAWTIGGPSADSGLTGRKIVADQYGGWTPVGGGAFSGKDLTKVDRSGAYAARNIAIDVLKRFDDLYSVEIQLAYAIGVSKPMSVNVKLVHQQYFNALTTPEDVVKFINDNYDLRPAAIIKRLALDPFDYKGDGCHFKDGYVGKWNG